MTAITIKIQIQDLANTLEIYNRIEVHRSTTLDTGPYTELTDPVGPTAALIDGSVAGPWTLNGTSLDVSVDGFDPITIDFIGTDPLNLQEVINQINSVSDELASEKPTDTDQLRLTSPSTGTGSSVLVLSGAAATTLGLSTTKVEGKARRLRIVEPTTIYHLIDLDGSNSFWYKYRFSSTLNSQISVFSDPILGGATTVVPSGQLIGADVQLVNGLGQPISGQSLLFVLMNQFQVPTTPMWALSGFHTRATVVTDLQGKASVRLLKGATYRVLFEGTSFIREFVVPSSGSSFDLMSIIGTAPDPYDIVQTPPRPIKVTI